MSTAFTFRKAVREHVGLLIGMVGGTGSGKTYSALRLATGLAGGKPFALIDTEAGRAKHYAAEFNFDHGDLAAPFAPDHYAEAINAADKAGYSVIVVDSASHEWAGDGGCLDEHDRILDDTVERKRKFAESKGWQFDEWKTREANNISAWIDPKMAHKRMVQRLLQVRAHLILCFRAEEKIEIVKDEKGKTVVQPKQSLTGAHGWIPVCEKNLPYELTLSFLMHASAPGVPRPIKLQAQHRPFVPLDKPLDENVGKALAAWAAGGGTAPVATTTAGATAAGAPRFEIHLPNKEATVVADAFAYVAKMIGWLDKLEPAKQRQLRDLNKSHAEKLMLDYGIKEVGPVVDRFNSIEDRP